jgi:Tfp pilus assembly protein PilP
LAVKAPAVIEQARTEAGRTQDLAAELERTRARLDAAPAASGEAPALQGGTSPEAVGSESPAWHWHRVALGAGLTLELLRPMEAEGSRPAQLQLHLRGRYHQHGAFVAALGRHPQGLRLVSYQLQGDPAGLHAAQLRLELPVAGMPVLAGTATRRYMSSESLDPFVEPGPGDPWAGLPAPWLLEAQRPRDLLEGAPLSAFEFTGTLRQGGQWVAMLRLDQRVHAVRTGDYLGPQLGRVRRIEEQGLWLRELVRDASGRWTEQDRQWRVGQSP